jgi:hypothetical protein
VPIASKVTARWRGAALLPLGTLAVHQLRYLLAYGPHAGRELVSHGDTYIHSVLPACLGLLLLPAGALLGHLAQAWRRGQARDPGLSPRQLWAVATGLLIACFCAQEILEMLLETGHPAGLAGIFGSGGWWALPASAAVGALITLLVAGARAVVGVVARVRARALSAGRAAMATAPRPSVPPALRRAPLAACCAGRAPPAQAIA